MKAMVKMYQLYAFKIVADTTSSLISLLLVAIGVVALSFVFALEQLKCPNCSRNFGIRRTDSKRVERKEVYRTDTEIEIESIYRNTYECEFCGHKVSKFESVSETRNLTGEMKKLSTKEDLEKRIRYKNRAVWLVGLSWLILSGVLFYSLYFTLNILDLYIILSMIAFVINLSIGFALKAPKLIARNAGLNP